MYLMRLVVVDQLVCVVEKSYDKVLILQCRPGDGEDARCGLRIVSVFLGLVVTLHRLCKLFLNCCELIQGCYK